MQKIKIFILKLYRLNKHKLEKEEVTKEIDKPVFLLNCSPKAMTGSAEAKKMYVVGAKIL